MKKFNLFKMLAVLIVLITSINTAWAWEERTYDGNTKLYISNIKPNGWASGIWASDDNNRMFVYLEYNNSGGSYWVEATLEVSSSGKYNKGALYSVTPSQGTYKYFKIARGSSSSSISNETGKCEFVSGGGNFITHYKEGQGNSQITWGSIDPRPITSDGSGIMYFDIDPAGCSWWKNDDGDYKFAYFFNDETGKWSDHAVQVTSDYYKVNVPSGTWKGVIMTRQKVTSNPAWTGDNGVNNQTADIPFNHGKNYLSNFVPNDFDYILSWDDFVPSGDTLLNGTMNNWELITAKRFSKGELAITLPARKTMSFKILVGNDGSGTWYGLTNANCILSDMSGWGMLTDAEGGQNVRINTAGNSTYTFKFNASNQLSVTYPKVTHPNADYVYLIQYGWSSWRIHFDQASTTYGIAATTWTGQELTVASGTITDTYRYTDPEESAQTYFYYAVGDYPKFNFNDNSGTNQTNDQTPYPGQYIYNNSSAWVWGNFVFGVTFNVNGGTINTGGFDRYTFGVGATLPTNVTRAGYTFGGWYAASDFSGGAVTEITTTDNTAKEYWAKWTPVEYLTFKSNATTSDWGTSSNWDPACVPTIEHNVKIQKSVVINEAAKAKSVLIDQSSSSNVKLTINAGKSLVIAGTLQKKNGSGTGATEEADVLIDSDLSHGNGALIMKTHDGTNKATVNFATKAYKDASRGWVNQYIGTPFKNQGDPTYNYYGMELYEFDAANQAWASGLASSMTPFYGYDLLSNSSTPNVVLNMTGTLVASSTQNLTGLSYAQSPYENVLANSWVAPIVIDEFVDDDFTNLKKTIYIFNAGSLSDYESNSGAIADDKNMATQAGQYTSIPINLSPFNDNYKTIPSMQSFSVIATGSSPSLRLRYKELVYDPASTSVLIEPNHAPKRVNGVKPEIVKVYVTGESGYGDKIWLVERTDFTTGYDDGWEAEKLYGILEAPQLYAVGDEDNMAVIALPDVDNTVLGFQAGTEDNQYTFLFDYEGEDALYLYDTQTEKETRITSDATYTFTTADKVAHNRFVISKAPKHATGVDNTNAEGVKARKQLIDGVLYIVRDGKLYNATGALVK